MSWLWRLRALGRNDALRRAVKAGFRLVFRHGRTVRIPLGPLRGMRWYVHRDHQFWMPLGVYEAETAAWLKSALSPGDVFYDVGGNAGYFALLGSRAVGSAGHVHVFEPVPTNADVIERHLAANRIDNVTVHRVALTDRDGQLSFTVESNNANSHLADVDAGHFTADPADHLTVEGRTLDHVADDIGPPTVAKIDVEGAEVLVLAGAGNTLESHRPKLIVSTHSAELRSQCRDILTERGYPRVESLPGFEHELIAG